MLFFLAGVAVLGFGGVALVGGATRVARKARISNMVIGLTVVAFGTSLPELVTSLTARVHGDGDMAMGNVVGSNIANLLLVLPLGALMHPLPVESSMFKRDFPILLAVTLLFTVVIHFRQPGPPVGAGFILLLLVFTAFQVLSSRRASKAAEAQYADLAGSLSLWPPWHPALVVAVGLLSLVVGGTLVVYGATDLAHAAGVPKRVVGLTIVAVGTSMPEIATTLAAAWRREADVAIGNVIGSNIFNILGISGSIFLVGPTASAERLLSLDAPVLVGSTLLSGLLWWRGRTLSRVEAAILLAGYVIYVGLLVS